MTGDIPVSGWDPDRFGVIYQIYPRSFQDSDGDGVGDLRGIQQRLDHLAWLGIGTIWLSPIYPSPMVDFGYDVADHRDVDPVFGSLDDFDRLLDAVHRRGMRLILDLVPNHTSDQHPWFIDSRSSLGSDHRDWYIWADPTPDGRPPNNWRSHFGDGPAWTFDRGTGQYYLHSFTPQQPDLNWRTPDVAAAFHDVMRFWLDRGVDGFRVDVVDHLIKDPGLRDQPPGPEVPGLFQPSDRAKDLPEVHDVIRGLRAVVDEYDRRLLIGEVWLPPDRLTAYHGEGDELHLPFNFGLLGVDWEADVVRGLVDDYEAALPDGAWPNWVAGNHDRSRVATRLGRDAARVAMMALLTLRGTPTVYYGDELGMTDVEIPPGSVRDPQGADDPDMSRDPARTPMPWTGDRPGGGFTAGVPWLPVGDANLAANVTSQRADPRSMLTLTQRLVQVRSGSSDLLHGAHRSLIAARGLFAFRRGERTVVALNLTGEKVTWKTDERLRVLLSTHLDRTGEAAGAVALRPDEGLVMAGMSR